MITFKKGSLTAISALGLAVTGGAAAQDSTAGSENQLKDPPSAFMADKRKASWHAEVQKTERGHMIGNPDAEASLIEWISYTCGHCATFAREGESALDLALLAPGHMNVEVRPVIRNSVDLTISLLVQCGGAESFKERHRMYLMRQESWMTKLRNTPQSQMQSWSSGHKTSRISMAAALDLDDMLAERGVSRMDITTCLNDDQAALKLVQNGAADKEEFAYPGTPSFALDGKLLDQVHTWGALYPVIAERFKPQSSSQ
ncbi:MAG: thioredoxin domain-containing protein [Pseudomonadota bacterium]